MYFKPGNNVLDDSMNRAGQEEARERFQDLAAVESSILDAIPQAIVGLHNRRIIFANNAVRETFGWDREELIGRNVSMFYRSEDESKEIARYFYSTLRRQRTFVNEFRCRRKDGKDILCRMRAARIGDKLMEKRIVVTYEDITEKRHSEEELERSREQLRNLSAYLQSVREKESTRIAREIHDELGQSLTALQMDVAWLGGQIPSEYTSLREKTQRMAHLVDATIDSVHRIMSELRPILLDDLGLTAAIEWQAKDFQAKTGIFCALALQDVNMDGSGAISVFRIFQESLTNTARHANATAVRIQLFRKNGSIIMQVRDNGRGIKGSDARSGRSLGIAGMKERALLLKGQIDITGAPGEGTTVTLTIPDSEQAIS